MSRHDPAISLSKLVQLAAYAGPITATQRHFGPQECAANINGVTSVSKRSVVNEAFERLFETAAHTGVSLLPIMQMFSNRVVHNYPDVTVGDVLERCTGDWRQRLVS
ncbi:hypothetical protein [Brevundimonas sp. TWP2-3-4b1]|uniref:hypothetical protein n=1 Tax=Brevundimonas sp. TWP2-3-4b1 TaxID=2804580 RepID=UPI003CFAA582